MRGASGFCQGYGQFAFQDWLPADRTFPEEEEKFSSSLKAVRHVYELLPQNPQSLRKKRSRGSGSATDVLPGLIAQFIVDDLMSSRSMENVVDYRGFGSGHAPIQS